MNGWPMAGGDLGRLMRERDWSATPLGAEGRWDPNLRAAVELMLPSRAQIVLFWGEDYRAFYNDAYAPTIGDKHPQSLVSIIIELRTHCVRNLKSFG